MLPLAVTFLLLYKMRMKLLSTIQAAAVLGVNDSRIRQLIRDRQLPAIQVGRAYLLDESAVRAFQRSPLGRPKKENPTVLANSVTSAKAALTPATKKTATKKGGRNK